MGVINNFRGEYGFLSNFYPAEVMLDWVIYPTVEHAFQAAKTLDMHRRSIIRNAAWPSSAKRLGKLVYPLRSDWDGIRIDIMRQLVRQKFSKEPLKSRLLATGTAILVEGNTWVDDFWGNWSGVGENHLGKILMEVRKEIKQE